MVSVLATELKVYRFKPNRGNAFLRAIRIRSMPSFGGEIKPYAPCCKTYGMLKNLV
jgi:hypothetical protein